MIKAHFGPGGNCEAFAAKYKGKGIYAPRWVKENGLDAYEYEAGRGIMATEDALLTFGAEARAQGIRLSLHAPYFISLASVEPEKRMNSIRYIADSLYAAELIGASIIVVHMGGIAKQSREDAMRLSADTVAKTLEMLPDNGVLIGLETMGKINQLGTLEEVISLCKMDRRLSPVVDFGHLNARNLGNTFPDVASYRQVFEKIGEELGDDKARFLHCHFSRILYTEKGGEKNHVTFADTQWGPEPAPLMQAIAELGVSPTIICESAGTQTADAVSMKNDYERMLKHEH